MGDLQLRLALAMRGGVSLAVWIGGACGEIDQVRRANAGEGDNVLSRPLFWDRVTGASPFSSVAVDVLAGASAGGLNGVIYAASQVYGFSMSRLRDL